MNKKYKRLLPVVQDKRFLTNSSLIKRKPSTPLSFDERKEIERLLRDGLSSGSIAKALGRGRNSIATEWRRAGGKEQYTALKGQKIREENRKRQSVGSANEAKKRMPPEILAKIHKLYQDGFSFYQIGRAVGLSHHRLHTAFKMLNLPFKAAFQLIQDMQDRLYALEQQVEVMFTMLKQNNGENYDNTENK